MSKAHMELDNKASFKSWLVVLTAALFFFYEFVQMNMFGSISKHLMHDFNINALSLGNLSAMYFYANVIFMFVAGNLLDRFSTRLIIVVAMTLCVINTYIFAMSEYFWLAALTRFFTGMAATVTMLSCVRLASRWFPPRQMALIIGLVVTMAMLGGTFAQTPMTILTEHFGWRNAVLINATVGLVFVFIIWFVVKDHPKYASYGHEIEQHKLKELGVKKAIVMACKNPQNWLAGIYTNLLSLPIILLGALWGILYLTQARHFSAVNASYITSMIFVGTIVGSPVIGWFSDSIGRRKLPMIVGSIISLGLILIITHWPFLNFYPTLVLFFLLGFFASSQVITYALVAESNPRMITTTSEGLSCTIIMAAGAIFQPLFGELMDLNWDNKIIDGVRIYSEHAYMIAMSLIVGAFVVSTIISFFIKETYCQNVEYNNDRS